MEKSQRKNSTTGQLKPRAKRTYLVSFAFTYRFNKREDDFPSLKEYNDYLEEVEEMSELVNVFNWISSSCPLSSLTMIICSIQSD